MSRSAGSGAGRRSSRGTHVAIGERDRFEFSVFAADLAAFLANVGAERAHVVVIEIIGVAERVDLAGEFEAVGAQIATYRLNACLAGRVAAVLALEGAATALEGVLHAHSESPDSSWPTSSALARP